MISNNQFSTSIQTFLYSICISGFVIPQISSFIISSTPSDCLAAVNTCMSDLCKSQQAFYGGNCEGKNDTIHNFNYGASEHGVIFTFSSGITKVLITFPLKTQDMRLFN